MTYIAQSAEKDIGIFIQNQMQHHDIFDHPTNSPSEKGSDDI